MNWDQGDCLMKKKPRAKISWHCPFKWFVLQSGVYVYNTGLTHFYDFCCVKNVKSMCYNKSKNYCNGHAKDYGHWVGYSMYWSYSNWLQYFFIFKSDDDKCHKKNERITLKR
jgi:hypothetical protein